MHKIFPVSVGNKHFNRDLMLEASEKAEAGLYTIVQYKDIYVMLIPISDQEGLLLEPKLDPIDDLHNVFANIDFVNHSINTAKLTYYLYTGKPAPDWDITLLQLHGAIKAVRTVRPMNELVAFHVYTVKMIEALTILDEKKFKESLRDMQGCHVFGQALTTTNVIRGQKDILIDLISKLTDNLSNMGFPAGQAIQMQTQSVQKIEYQTNILNFDAWLREIPWIYFSEFRRYQKSLFQDKAERIKDYLANHLQDNSRLKDIAKALNMSEQTLNTVFKKKFQVTIKQFYIQLKIEAAKRFLLTTRIKIKDIADYLAFIDESYFVMTFSKIVGCTPAKYRQTGRHLDQKKSIKSKM